MTVGFEEEITFAEVRKHNTHEDAWCAIHGGVYELSRFAKVHPGGDIILLAAGKEATVLFETYHVRGVPDAVLRKYRIGKLPASETAKELTANANPDPEGRPDRNVSGPRSESYYTWNSEFYKTLRKRVVARLEERGIARRGGHEIWIKAALLLLWFGVSLWLMCTLDPRGGAMLAAVSLGISAAFVGTCIQHDGNHGAFSESRWLNKLAGWTLDMIGASGMTWEFQHVLGHHPYTNLIEQENGNLRVQGKNPDAASEDPTKRDQESDPDVFSTFPMLRLHPWHKRSWYHRYQHIYAPFMFGLMTLSKVIMQDFRVATNRRLFQIDAQCRYSSPWYRLRFWGMKALTFCYMLALPMYCQGVLQGLKLFLLAHFTAGELLATMFIVNHIIEGVAYASKDAIKGTMAPPKTAAGVTPMAALQQGKKEEDKIPLDDWAAVQCQTSVNWSVGSWFWNHFSGGLCHQIEHHLFPGVVHTSYVHFADVVEDTCAEFGVPYQKETSLFTAYFKMIEHLRLLGTQDCDEWK